MNIYEESEKVYICGVAYQHEVGETDVTVYPSVEYLKKEGVCWDSCGIVECEVKGIKWVHPQDLFKDLKEVDMSQYKETDEKQSRINCFKRHIKYLKEKIKKTEEKIKKLEDK